MPTISILESYTKELFFIVKIRIKFRDLVLAGIPKSQNVLDFFMNARHMSDAEKADFKQRIADGNLTDDEKESIKEVSWCQFEKDAQGNLCLYHGNVKAMLREIFTTFGLTQRRPNKTTKGEANADKDLSAGGRQTFQHAVHVDPIRIPFEHQVTDPNVPLANTPFVTFKATDGFTEVDESAPPPAEGQPAVIRQPEAGYVDKVKHIQDAAGRRSALGRHDYIRQPEMSFILKWPARGCFTEEDMKSAMAAAQEDGLGACRSQGFGKFDVIGWEVVNAPAKKAKPAEEEGKKSGKSKKSKKASDEEAGEDGAE